MGMIKVTLEPDLEIQAVTLTANQCDALANTYRRWAHQLAVKASIMRRSASRPPSGVRLLRPIARRLLLRN